MKFLLITPNLFGYYKEMMLYLEGKGHQCKQYFDYTNLKLREKIWIKLINKQTSKSFDEYWEMLIEENKNEKYDRIVLIFGDKFICDSHIKKLRLSHPESYFIYYNWDSVSKYPNILTFYKLFDRYISFDKEDCRKYGFEFRPLFYSNDIVNCDPEYDCCISTTFGVDKVKEFEMVNNLLPKTIKKKYFLYLGSLKSYYYNKIFNARLFKNYKKENFSFNGMTRDQNNRFVANAKVVIDIPRKGQNGLTMRTFEVLHLKRKLITTNKNIKTYEFYNPNNIYVIEDSTKPIPVEFFDSGFDVKHELSRYYSFAAFMDDVFLT